MQTVNRVEAELALAHSMQLTLHQLPEVAPPSGRFPRVQFPDQVLIMAAVVEEVQDSKRITLETPFLAQPAVVPVVVVAQITRLLLMEYLLGLVQAPDKMERPIPAAVVEEDLHAMLGKQIMAPTMEHINVQAVEQAQMAL
jgi:hypothetical protein